MPLLRNTPVGVLVAILVCSPLRAQNAEESFRQGVLLFTEGKADAAIAAFERSVRLSPEFAPAWKSLGVVYASRGDFERAETPFRNACERDLKLPDACLYYGRTLYLLNRFQPAVEVLRSTIRRQPENGEAYRLLALSWEALGKNAEAGDAFQHAVRLSRDAAPDEDAGIDYGVFLFREGRAEAALAPLEAALHRHPASGRALLELGCIELALDRLPQAAEHLEKSLALNPSTGRAHLLLGRVYLRQGKTQAAEEHLRQGSRTVK